MTSLAFIPFHFFAPLFKKSAVDDVLLTPTLDMTPNEQRAAVGLLPMPAIELPKMRKAWESADIGMVRAAETLQVRIAELITLRDETLRELDETQIRFDAISAALAQVALSTKVEGND